MASVTQADYKLFVTLKGKKKVEYEKVEATSSEVSGVY